MYLHQLGSTGPRMGFQLATFGPAIRGIVMVDIAEEQAVGSFVNNETKVAAHAYRPEVLVLRSVQSVELHAGIGGIQLQVERCRLGKLLLVAGEASEAVGEG